MKYIGTTLTGLVAALACVSVQAQSFNLLSAGPTKELATDTSVTVNVASDLGAGILDIQIAGYKSLDGVNSYEDVFTLYEGKTEIFSGSFNMGGGGRNEVLFNPDGAKVVTTTNGAKADPHHSTAVTWEGGVTDIWLPLADLTAGPLVFSYTSLSGPGYAGFQGLGDEGWGVNSVKFVTAPVPEPQTYALMLAGLGVVSFVARRRRGI